MRPNASGISKDVVIFGVTDDDPPARKSARAVTYASSDVSSPLRSPAACSHYTGHYRASPLRGPPRITSSRPRPRPTCVRRFRKNGRRPLVSIWPISTLTVPGGHCLAPGARCFTGGVSSHHCDECAAGGRHVANVLRYTVGSVRFVLGR